MKSAVARADGAVRRLLRDEGGSALTNLFSMASAMPVAIGFSFLTMQLFQSSYHRDMVDHAASIASDAVTKSLCSNSKDFGGVPRGVFAGGRQVYVEEQVRSRLSQYVPNDKCRVLVKPAKATAMTTDLGSLPMDVEVTCDAPCNFPFAAQVLCTGSPRHLTLSASRTAVPMGCDAGEGW